MDQHIGLDVSLKDTSISVRQDGRRVWRGKCASDPKLLAEVIRKRAPNAKRVVFETGPLSVWFYHALTAEGLPAICIDARHAIQRKPGALRNGAPFLELPDPFQRLQRHLLRSPGGDREMVEILALVLHHDEQAVLTAVTMALEAGVPTKTHILNLLHRLLDGKPLTTPPITAPQALRLVSEPLANVERYDALRGESRHAS